MQLSPHFALDEFCRSHAAVHLGIDMTPTPAIVAALQSLTVNVLEPLRARLDKPLRITSGYRPPRLNDAIGGAPGSQHQTGEAADVEVDGMTPLQLCQAAIAAGLPFDQIILEFGWMHVSHRTNGSQRGEVLTALHINGRTDYHPGLPV